MEALKHGRMEALKDGSIEAWKDGSMAGMEALKDGSMARYEPIPKTFNSHSDNSNLVNTKITCMFFNFLVLDLILAICFNTQCFHLTGFSS